ncbi:MAG: Rpn family recombination-promoting nuclease/putative transposase [Tissierellaceae bacterium]
MGRENKDSKDKGDKNKLTHPHDATFKKTFGDIEIARDVIEKNLPEDILEYIQIETLKKLDGSFISEQLKESFSDIIYGVNINGREAYISILFEHKSYKDKLTIFQVTRYIIDIWSKIIEGGKKELPIVVPIVVYHGKEKWNYKNDISELIPGYENLPEYLKERTPILKHDIINIRRYSEKDIERYQPLTRMIIRSFKYIFDEEDKLIESLLVSVDEVADTIPDEKLHIMVEILLIYYSSANKELTEEAIINKIRKLEGKGEKIMTILELRELRGLEKGLERGLEQGLEQGLEKGMEQGLEKGLEKGKIEGKVATVMKILAKKFRTLPSDVEALISGLEMDSLDLIIDNIFELEKLEDLLGLLKENEK